MRGLAFILIFCSTGLFAQQTNDWLASLENPPFPSEKLVAQNKLAYYVKHDLSSILMPSSEILGYIGNDYQRIHVNFESVERSKSLSNLYFIKGKTVVSGNKCDFEGTVTIEQFREFRHMSYGLDSMYSAAGIKAQGVAIGSYKFSENRNQKHVGVFQGVMTLWWYLDKNGEIQFFDIDKHSDRFKNNQYVGTWSEYGKGNTRVCNWGEFRIPFSGDLDWGAGGFSVNPKYYSKGWEAFDKY
ncbi:hypothetical protein [Roseivirga pacifica]|uniref:hypothetical protein n=1 Tax=Roseivirga pacifica TaxID=1267423 RepID=UPI003BAF2B35